MKRQRCKYCRAPILFMRHLRAGGRLGSTLVLDAVPLEERPERGTTFVTQGTPSPYLGPCVRTAAEGDSGPFYVSHHATCTQASAL